MPHVNYLAVLVSAIAAMVIGAVWWGPLFGKMWMKENGFDQMGEDQKSAMKSMMTSSYIQQFILSLIQAWVLAGTFGMLGTEGAAVGIKVAVMLWLGFMLPIQYGNKIWGG